MPAKNKKTLPPSLSRTVATFAPLALALLVGNAVLPGSHPKPATSNQVAEVKSVACGEDLEDYKACHTEYPTGCNTNGSYDAYLNLFKNQVNWDNPQPQAWLNSLQQFQDLEKKIPAGLSKNNHGDHLQELKNLGEGSIFGTVGYLYDIKTEGKESSNCQIEGGEDFGNVDFHIYIGFDPSLAAKLKSKTATPQEKKQIDNTSVIVEMTPHYRGRFKPEWTAQAVKAAIGSRVRITGQLMVDNEHYVSSQDCGHANSTDSCWRATVWELHPVTDLQVCNTDSCPDQNSVGWVALGAPNSVETASDSRSHTAQPRGQSAQ
jgi:hypothetical protein